MKMTPARHLIVAFLWVFAGVCLWLGAWQAFQQHHVGWATYCALVGTLDVGLGVAHYRVYRG